MGILINILWNGLLAAGGGREKSFWFPEQASTVAPEVDFIFDFIFWLSSFFFVLIVGLTILFVIQYRARPGHKEQPTSSHNTALELTWTIIPTILVVVIFYYGYRGFMNLVVPPRDCYEVGVVAQRWSWQFSYPNGFISDNLHVPAGVPVRLTMTSEDVIHAFFVPDFRVKRDIVPGRYNITWFEAVAPGEHNIFCAEYCGTSHSDMLAKVIVHEKNEFEQWLDESANVFESMPPAEAGEMLYNQRGCTQCHTVDGTTKIGPSFKSAWGVMRTLTDGNTVIVDENYVRQSIVDPQSQLVAGYEPVMPTYQGRFKDSEITYIIEFVKTLGDDYVAPTEAPAETPEEASPEAP